MAFGRRRMKEERAKKVEERQERRRRKTQSGREKDSRDYETGGEPRIRCTNSEKDRAFP